MSQTPQSRNFTFTWNNYPEDHEAKLRKVKGVKYCCYGKEVGTECQTPHLQGTIIYNSPKKEPQVRKHLPGCHVEICKHLHPSITYCKKDNDFIEFGTPPKTNTQIGQDEQERWKNILTACEENRMEDVPWKIRFNQPRICEYHRNQASKKRKLDDTLEQHLWYYGESRTGKSRKARSDHPEAYLKMCNKWWDGYEDEDTVLIEDLDEAHECLAHHLKIWADRYPYLAEVKGGARKIRPKLIIVTSIYQAAMSKSASIYTPP